MKCDPGTVFCLPHFNSLAPEFIEKSVKSTVLHSHGKFPAQTHAHCLRILQGCAGCLCVGTHQTAGPQ